MEAKKYCPFGFLLMRSGLGEDWDRTEMEETSAGCPGARGPEGLVSRELLSSSSLQGVLSVSIFQKTLIIVSVGLCPSQASIKI